MAKVVKVDQLESIIEDFDNFLLEKTCKVGGEALNLLRNLTYDIILLP